MWLVDQISYYSSGKEEKTWLLYFLGVATTMYDLASVQQSILCRTSFLRFHDVTFIVCPFLF